MYVSLVRARAVFVPLASPARRRAAARLLPLLLLLLLLHAPAWAADGPTPEATMITVKNAVVFILRGLMSIALVIGLLKVAKNFLSGSPDAFTSFFWLIGGLVIFYGWGYFFKDTFHGTPNSPSVGTIGNSCLDKAVSAGAYEMAQGILTTMLTFVVPLLLFTNIVLTIVRGFISSGNVQFELSPIFRMLFLYIALLGYNTYVPMVGNLIGGLAVMINNTSKNTSAASVLAGMKGASTGVPPAPGAAPGGAVTPTGPNAVTTANGTTATAELPMTYAGTIAAVSGFFTGFSAMNFILGLATDGLTMIVQLIMEFIQSFLLGFLYVSGPIAIAFSFIPGFGGLAKSWLQSLIGIHMWSVAFQVIAGLFIYYSAHVQADAASSFGGAVASVTGLASSRYATACIVFIIMYIMVPYMSSLIVGSSAADGFVGSALRIGAALASGGAAAAGAGMKVAGAGAQGVNAATDAAAGAGKSLSGLDKAGAFATGAAGSIKSSIGGGAGSNMSKIGQMMGPPPPMAAAGNDAAQESATRTDSATGTVPAVTAPTPMAAVVAPAPAMSGQSIAAAAAPNGGQSAAAAGVPNMAGAMGSSAGTTSQQAANAASGGSTTGGFGAFAGTLSTAAAPAIAIPPNQKPPTLSGSGA